MKKQIEIPTKCPACAYPLTTINMQLFCKNTACDARASKQIEHFCKVLSIKGMGEKTIQKLGISEILELYNLSLSDIIEKLGSEKLGNKLYDEINKSKEADLSLVLASFGIPLIGNTAATKLCAIVSSIDEIDFETCKAAGLGDIASKNLTDFLDNEFKELREFLPFTFNSTKIVSVGKNVCITGKLSSFSSKAEANVALVKAGFNVVGSVTKSTDYLVDEDHKGSAKRLKADSLGIKVVSNLSIFLRDNIK